MGLRYCEAKAPLLTLTQASHLAEPGLYWRNAALPAVTRGNPAVAVLQKPVYDVVPSASA
jgi:hypothetical protein